MPKYPGEGKFTKFYEKFSETLLCLWNTYSVALTVGVHSSTQNNLLFLSLNTPHIPWEKLTQSTRKLKKFSDFCLHWKMKKGRVTPSI